ncbi:hypothetical protein [Streptomyces sp. NPDC002386]
MIDGVGVGEELLIHLPPVIDLELSYLSALFGLQQSRLLLFSRQELHPLLFREGCVFASFRPEGNGCG